MRKYLISFAPLFLACAVLLAGCNGHIIKKDHYDEIPSVLEQLTLNVQSAVDQGYYEKGESAVLEYVGGKKPDLLGWFSERNYELRVGVVGEVAVVMVCDEGRPVFEDTFCRACYDKDHRKDKGRKACEITMTLDEVNAYCNKESMKCKH